jgi:hypothetical protein
MIVYLTKLIPQMDESKFNAGATSDTSGILEVNFQHGKNESEGIV